MISSLRHAFGLPVQEAATGTAMLQPSPVSMEIAANIISNLDLTTIVTDLGAIAAREFANELSSMALRPADYTVLPDITSVLALRIAQHLVDLPDTFSQSLLSTLQNRG